MRDNVYPFLRYDDCPAAMEFLQKAFGAELVANYGGPDGKVAHAELRFGSGIVMTGSTREPRSRTPEGNVDKIEHGIYIAVEDIEALFERARAAGATMVRPLEDTDYGSREFSALDPEGYWWSFGTFHPAEA